jgi:transposase-like protein
MDQIDAAMAHLRAQNKQNYAAAARTYGVEPTTLRRRYLAQTRSRVLANLEDRQLLNNVQEDTLLGYIDRLTDKHIFPTM